MANKAKQAKAEEEKRESGLPGGGQGRKDEVGGSGVYPVSEMEGAAPDATVHGETSFGQGERGPEGYNDAGESGIILLDEELNEIKKEEENNQKE
jgi:hypothetical protein